MRHQSIQRIHHVMVADVPRLRAAANHRSVIQLRVLRDEVFPHFRQIGKEGGAFGDFMKDAALMIQKPSVTSGTLLA